MSLFYISSWLTLKKTRVILQDVVRLMSSVQLQNCKNYAARLEASGRTIIARAIFGNTSVHGRFIACAKSIHWKAWNVMWYVAHMAYEDRRNQPSFETILTLLSCIFNIWEQCGSSLETWQQQQQQHILIIVCIWVSTRPQNSKHHTLFLAKPPSPPFLSSPAIWGWSKSIKVFLFNRDFLILQKWQVFLI